MTMKLRLFLLLAFLPLTWTYAQQGLESVENPPTAPDPESMTEPLRQPEKSYLRIINAVRAGTDPVWQSGLDLQWGELALARDIRAGEGGGYSVVESGGQDSMVIARSSSQQRLLAEKLEIPPASFTTLIIHGELTNNSAELKVATRTEEAERGEEKGNLHIYNGIGFFPVRMSLNEGAADPVPEAQWVNALLPPGTHQLNVYFQDERQREQRIQQQVLIQGTNQYLLVLMPNPHPKFFHRPRVLLVNETQMQQNALSPADGEETVVPAP